MAAAARSRNRAGFDIVTPFRVPLRISRLYSSKATARGRHPDGRHGAGHGIDIEHGRLTLAFPGSDVRENRLHPLARLPPSMDVPEQVQGGS